MMLQLQIERYTNPIIRNARRIGQDKSFKAGLKRYLNDAILLIEGFGNHLPALNKEQMQKTFGKIIEAKRQLVDIDEEISAADYYNDAELKVQFSYLLNTLSTLRARLHLLCTKEASVAGMSTELRNVLSTLSRTAVAQQFYRPAS